ncbi:DUF6893 family small protein [Actinomadura violacea]|uniref:Uncharacterized protein n=1 Tax=Actinomadura violacea TaxID=2819934 RepID=A0ABS3RLT9_9ACTN|nr:hypothetical protein [Actinomadura violacea]MBO2457680.1 hypothetical protein [Actinomadura violacea]
MGNRSRTCKRAGGRRTAAIAAACVAAAGLAALFWKEFPAAVRYIKIERM